ncbi:hypothetical protein V565_212170, partial [Rhizoctonia solani 123E]
MSPLRIATPTRSVPTVHPIVTTTSLSNPAGGDNEQRLSPTVSAELPPLPPSAVLRTGDIDEDPWQRYRAELEDDPNLGIRTPSDFTYRPSGVLRPQTEKIRTPALPPISEGSSVRQSLSMDPLIINRDSLDAPENTLGLLVANATQGNPSSSGQQTSDTTIRYWSNTPVPYPQVRLGAEEILSRGPLAKPVPGVGHQRTANASFITWSSSKTPTGQATSRTVSLNAEQADRTVTGSLLDVAARMFTESEGSGNSS